MTAGTKSRLFTIVSAVALVTVVACADSSTEPVVTGMRAARDTVPPNPEDTLECRSGWVIWQGRYACSGSGG